MVRSKILLSLFTGLCIVMFFFVQSVAEFPFYPRQEETLSVRSTTELSVSSWQPHTAPITSDLYSITGIGNHLWIAGSVGTLISSTDNGAAWNTIDTHFTGTWHSVAFFNQSYGFLAGTTGTFARSTDGGLSWEFVNTGIMADFNAQRWVNSTHGWLVGNNGVLLSTQDSGVTWIPRPLPWINDLSAITFINESHGWLVGSNGLVAATRDGGLSWQALPVPNLNDWNIVSTEDGHTIWVAGTSGGVLVTTDGGMTWTEADIGSGTITTFLSIPPKTVLLAGENGLCLGTTNMGLTWTKYQTPSLQTVLGGYASSNAIGWLVGRAGLILCKPIAPSVTITSPTNTTYVQDSVTLTYNVSYGTVIIYLDGIANTSALPSGSLLSSLAEGSHNLTIVAVDTAGNVGQATVLFTIDTTAPIVTITSPTNTTYAQDSVTLIYSISDGTVTIYLDGVANTSVLPSGSLLSSLAEGSHNLTIVAVDTAGNVGQANVLFTVDMSAPTVTITSPTNTTYAQDSVLLTYSVSDGTAIIYLDGVANTSALPSGSLLSSLIDGSHNLTIVAEDDAGNIGQATVLFTIDTSAPVVTITSPMNTTYAQDSVLLTYSVSDGTVTIYLDGLANSTAMESGAILSSLADGSHNLTIVAVDDAGNTGQTTVFFTVDTTAPSVTITSPTNTTYAQDSILLTYSISDGTVTIYLDGVANTSALPSGSLLSSLTDGSHNLTIVAVDNAGNVGQATVLFTVDTSAPVVTITSPTNTTYAQDSVLLTYSVSDGTVTIYLDGVANSTATESGSILSNLADGSHNLTIVAVDTAGNIGQVTVLFTVDTTAPSVTITSPTNTTYAQDSVTLIYSVSDGTVTIYLDGVANTSALPSGSLLSSLAEGSHNLTIVAVDDAGNMGQATVLFTIDTSAPVVTITSPTNTTYAQDSVLLTYTISDGTVTVYLDGVANTSALPSGSLLSSLAEGSHNLTIVAVDNIGNTGQFTVLFTVDTTAPTVTITSPTNTTYTQDSVTLIYSVSDGTVTIYLDGVVNSTAMESGSILSSLAEGSHNLTIVAVDDAGNVEQITVFFTVATPTTSITSTISTSTSSTTSAPTSGFLLGVFFLAIAVMCIIKRYKKSTR